jgi:hypothetical protein
MKKVIQLSAIPESSTVLHGFGRVDYQDIYQVEKTTDKRAEEISREIMQLPDWVKALLKLRNLAVGAFGLKTDKNTTKPATFFTPIENRADEIVMGEADRHLDFRASIIKTENKIALITLVHYNNVWGKVYFFLVKPFHKIIMKTLLKRYTYRVITVDATK